MAARERAYAGVKRKSQAPGGELCPHRYGRGVDAKTRMRIVSGALIVLFVVVAVAAAFGN